MSMFSHVEWLMIHFSPPRKFLVFFFRVLGLALCMQCHSTAVLVVVCAEGDLVCLKKAFLEHVQTSLSFEAEQNRAAFCESKICIWTIILRCWVLPSSETFRSLSANLQHPSPSLSFFSVSSKEWKISRHVFIAAVPPHLSQILVFMWVTAPAHTSVLLCQLRPLPHAAVPTYRSQPEET